MDLQGTGEGIMTSRNIRIGRLGEQAARRYLEERGYRVLEHNWRSPAPDHPGELDLVLRDRRELVVCEVKTRTGAALAHPAEAVTPEKAARLRRLAVLWLRAHPAARSRSPVGRSPAASAVRIDVVAVRLGPREPHPLICIDHLRAVV
jgi:putative endonuclease